MLHEAYYYYYGVIIPIGDVSTRMYANKDVRKDIYCYVLNHGLNYRRVGNVRTTWRICIGYEIKHLTHTKYDLDRQKCYMQLFPNDVRKHQLTNDLRIKIETALINIGCIFKPNYWVFYNHFYDGINEKK